MNDKNEQVERTGKEKKIRREPDQSARSLDALRQQAEGIVKGELFDLDALTPSDLQFIIHELQVHQVELQLQNEELRRLQLELETSRDNFANLYDFAPICYCTLDHKGIIRDVNQICSEIFGVEKQKMIGQRLNRFIHQEDQEPFYLHHQAVMRDREKKAGEVRVIGFKGDIHHVQIQSVVHGSEVETQI